MHVTSNCLQILADTLLIAPLRKVPAAHIVSAATSGNSHNRGADHDPDDEDDNEKTSLPSGAARWEHAVVDMLRRHTKAPGWAIDWVVSTTNRRCNPVCVSPALGGSHTH
jgi:hypothetical protein